MAPGVSDGVIVGQLWKLFKLFVSLFSSLITLYKYDISKSDKGQKKNLLIGLKNRPLQNGLFVGINLIDFCIKDVKKV